MKTSAATDQMSAIGPMDRDDEPSQATLRVRQRKTGMDYLAACSIIGIFIILAASAIHTLSAILMPVTLAVVVGIVLGKAADRLARFGLPPILGGLLLAVIFVLAVFWLINAMVDPLSQLAAKAPDILQGISARLQPYMQRYDWIRLALSEDKDGTMISSAVIDNAGAVLGMVAGGLTPALVQTLIFLAALGLFLLGRVKLRHALVMAFTGREQRLSCLRVMKAIEDALGFYFSTASLIYAALGIVTMIIAWMGGLAMAPMWGLFAFVSSFIPYLGVAAMTLALLIGGLMTHDAILLALSPAIAFFLLHLVMENIVTPAILGHRLEINPFIIFIAILLWTWMWGAVGAMLALPLSLIAMTIVEQVRIKPPERKLPG